jgi:RimJ/RimL family protein N-acetyltransferase
MTDQSPALDGAALNAVIETARLRIEPLAARHAAPMFEGTRHPAIYEWISLAPSTSVEHLEQRWARVAARALVAQDVFDLGWAVQRVDDGAWIGKLDAEVQAHGVATNVGYFFFPPFWGRGYATEAVTALSQHLARHGVVEQRATVTLGNDASGRVLERAGFVRERLLPGNDTIRGVLFDDIEYVRRG